MSDSTLSLLVRFAALDRLTQPLRSMSGGARKAAVDIAATRREVLNLERQAAKVGGYRDLKGALDKDYAALDQARRNLRNLKLEMQSTDGPTGRLTQRITTAQAKVEKLSGKVEEGGKKLHAMGAELRGAGLDVGNLAKAEEHLTRSLGTANAKLDQQRDKAKKAADAASRLERAGVRGANLRAAGVRTVAVGAAIAAPGTAAAKDAREFGSIMTDIALKANITASATGKISRDILRLGPVVGQMPEDLARGVDALVGLGDTLPEALTQIRPIGRAATAYKADITDLANATYASASNLKVAAKDTERALDIMAYAGKKGAFEIKDMAGEFPALTAAANALGVSGLKGVADLSAAAQIARRGAGDSATAANNLLNLLNKINTADTYKNFKKFGIDLPAALKKAAKDGKSPIESIVENTIKATKGDMSKLAFLFQDAQVQAALRPLVQNLDEYRQIRADALKATGTVEADYQQRMATDGTAKQAKFNAQVERLKIIMGEKLLPVLNPLLEKIGNWLDAMSTWSERHPRLAAAISVTVTVLGYLLQAIGFLLGFWGMLQVPLSTVGGWFARLGPILLEVGGWLRWLATPIMWIVRIIGVAIGAIAAVLGLPVEAVVAIIAAIVALVALVWYYWDEIKAFVIWAWNGMIAANVAGFNMIVAGATAAWKWISGVFTAGWNWLKSTVMGVLQWFVGIHVQMFQVGVNIVQGIINGVGSMFGQLKAKIMSLGQSAVGWFKGVLGIHSPSRVFAQLGVHTMSGLAMGLDRGADKPLARIRAAGANLARAAAITVTSVAPAAASAAAPGVSGVPSAASAPVAHYEFNVTLKGGDAADMKAKARELFEEFKRLQRNETRSGYRDDDDG